jgi:DNA-binding transcriptional LysR family regulator
MRTLRLESLDLNLLLALHWLLEEQSVTAAASKVGLSQPAMSRALARLRQEFDDALFVQVGRRMVPTAFAAALQPTLARAIEQLRASVLPKAQFDPGSARGAFRVACTDYVGLVLSRAWSTSVHKHAPGLDLEIVTLEPGSLQRLVGGALDLVVMPDIGVGNLPKWLDIDQFVRRALFDEAFVCVARRGHPAAGKRLTVKQFAALDHVLASPSGQGLGVVDKLLKERGLERRIAYRIQSFIGALQVVAFTDCVAALPRRLVEASGQKWATIELPFEIPGFTLFAAWHPARTNDEAHRWTREQLSEALR